MNQETCLLSIWSTEVLPRVQDALDHLDTQRNKEIRELHEKIFMPEQEHQQRKSPEIDLSTPTLDENTGPQL